MEKRALITGANGQDGVWLSSYLLQLGYSVIGLVRNLERAVGEGVSARLIPDAQAPRRWQALLEEVCPDEIYHLGGDTFAGRPEQGAVSMLEGNVMLTAQLLEATCLVQPKSRVFLAGSAMAYGEPQSYPQSEATPRAPVSLYGASKALLHPLAQEYRSSGLFIRTGILYNHESILRQERFVTRKITAAAARIALGQQKELFLGNLDVVRDWGDARDYVRAMHLMLQQDLAEDRVIATGEGRTVREFCRMAFEAVNLDYEKYVKFDPSFWRPAEAIPLIGNSERLRNETGWTPSTNFGTLISEMVQFDLRFSNGLGPQWRPVTGGFVLDLGNVRLQRRECQAT